MANYHLISLDESLVFEDVYAYSRAALEYLKVQGLLDEGIDIGTLTQEIVRRSEGMFLWARLMLAYRSAPSLTRKQRLSTIFETESEDHGQLERLHEKIQSAIGALEKPSRELAHNALLWVAYCSLTAPELKEAIVPEGWDVDSDQSTEHFDNAVILCCKGFLEKKKNGQFRYIHLTAQQFVQDGSSLGISPQILPSPLEAKGMIARRLIEYLKNKRASKTTVRRYETIN